MPDVGELRTAVVAARHLYLAVEYDARVVAARGEISTGGHLRPGSAVLTVPDVVF